MIFIIHAIFNKNTEAMTNRHLSELLTRAENIKFAIEINDIILVV